MLVLYFMLLYSHFDALLPIILVGDSNSGKSDVYEQYTKGNWDICSYTVHTVL